jgi:hypothetical protein
MTFPVGQAVPDGVLVYETIKSTDHKEPRNTWNYTESLICFRAIPWSTISFGKTLQEWIAEDDR